MYDPNTPADHAELTGAMLRGKFNSLKDLIDALNTIAAQVDSTATLPADYPAGVSVNVIGNTLHFSFDIPRGAEGIPGEVTNVDLGNAISGTSSNTNAVNTLDTPFADPDAETLRQAYNALVLGLRRP